MAEFVMRDMAEKEGVDVVTASAATSAEEIGNGVHRGTRNKLMEHGISTDGKRARKLTKADYEQYDYIIGMEDANIRGIMRIIGSDPMHKVCKLLDFADGGDIADPWYTGDFDSTYDDVLRGCKGIIKQLKAKNY